MSEIHSIKHLDWLESNLLLGTCFLHNSEVQGNEHLWFWVIAQRSDTMWKRSSAAIRVKHLPRN